jgi:hypothetical protein
VATGRKLASKLRCNGDISIDGGQELRLISEVIAYTSHSYAVDDVGSKLIGKGKWQLSNDECFTSTVYVNPTYQTTMLLIHSL